MNLQASLRWTATGLAVASPLILVGIVVPRVGEVVLQLMLVGGLLTVCVWGGIILSPKVAKFIDQCRENHENRLESERRRTRAIREAKQQEELNRHNSIVECLSLANQRYGTQFPLQNPDLNRHTLDWGSIYIVFDPATCSACVMKPSSVEVVDYSWFIERKLEWINATNGEVFRRIKTRLIITVADIDAPQIVRHFDTFEEGERCYAWLQAILHR